MKVPSWLDQSLYYWTASPDNSPIAVLGNKADKEEDREVLNINE